MNSVDRLGQKRTFQIKGIEECGTFRELQGVPYLWHAGLIWEELSATSMKK